MSSREPVPTPPSHAVCGNGILDEIPGICEKVCAGGCSIPIACHVQCFTSHELCDGNAMADTCVQEGYAGGAMACTKACTLDLGGCLACIPGPSARCGQVGLTGDETYVVASAAGAAVFARAPATGRITGAKVDAKLQARPLSGLPAATLAAGALDGAVGFVDAKHRFGVIDASGRARLLGPVAEDARQLEVLRDSFHPGGAAVLAGDYQRRTLAVFDPPGPFAQDQPRHFYLGNHRLVVIPGSHELARGVTKGGADLVVIVFGNELFAYQRNGLELERLASVPPGINLAFNHPTYTDKLTWSSGQLTTTRRTDPETSAPPPGLSRAALSGASSTAAFGGVLIARHHGEGRRPNTELYWVAGGDPLAPSQPAPSSAVK